MKGRIKKLIYELFYKGGFYAPKRIESPSAVYLKLNRLPVAAQAYELKRITSFMAVIDNHNYYNNLLHAFVPDYPMPETPVQFVGKGIGQDSLDTFRKYQKDIMIF